MVKNLCLFPERLKGKIFVSESHILSLARKKVEKKKGKNRYFATVAK